MDTEIIKRELSDLDPTCDQDAIAAAIDRVTLLREAAREADRMLDTLIEGWLIANGRDITIGTVRYYYGVKKDYTPHNAVDVLNACIDLAAGDMEAAITDYLSVNAFKYGAIRKGLEAAGRGNEFDRLFDCVEKGEVREGKPVKTVQKIDTRFIR